MQTTLICYDEDGKECHFPCLNGFVSRVVSAVFNSGNMGCYADARRVASSMAELAAAYEHIAKLEADLNECREYIEQEVDVVDGSDGPVPNRAMQLVSMIDETLHGTGGF